MPPEDFLCEIPGCGRVFPSLIGLGQHIRHKHPENMDERTNTEIVNERWTLEEIKMLARREAELLLQQERDGRKVALNISLQAAFPYRTLDSVKGHRRYETYRRMVGEMVEEIRMGLEKRRPIRRSGRRSLVLDPPDEVPERALDDPFLVLFNSFDPPPQNNDGNEFNFRGLYEICRDTITESMETTMTRLSLYMQNIVHNDPSRAAAGPRRMTDDLSRKKVRRAEYARTQSC